MIIAIIVTTLLAYAFCPFFQRTYGNKPINYEPVMDDLWSFQQVLLHYQAERESFSWNIFGFTFAPTLDRMSSFWTFYVSKLFTITVNYKSDSRLWWKLPSVLHSYCRLSVCRDETTKLGHKQTEKDKREGHHKLYLSCRFPSFILPHSISSGQFPIYLSSV